MHIWRYLIWCSPRKFEQILMSYFLIRSLRFSSAPTSFLPSVSPPSFPACAYASLDMVQTCCPGSGLWKQSCMSRSWGKPRGGLPLLPLGAALSPGPPACSAVALSAWLPSPCTAASAAAPWQDQSWMYFHRVHESNRDVPILSPSLGHCSLSCPL